MQDALREERMPTKAEISSLKQYAARALGYFESDLAIDALTEMLNDKDPVVRVTAAASILKNVDPPYNLVAVEERSKLKVDSSEAKNAAPRKTCVDLY